MSSDKFDSIFIAMETAAAAAADHDNT